MLSVRPIRDSEKEKELCKRENICGGYDCIYLACEDDKEVGWMTVRQDGDRILIITLEMFGCENYENMDMEQAFLAELMVRSTLVYAQNRFVDKIACADSRLFRFLERFKFDDADGIKEIAVEKMLNTCGGCH